MNAPTRPSPAGAERRREKRYEVELPGVMRQGDVALPVRLSDVSASGALAVVDEEHPAFSLGQALTLEIEGFDSIESRIVHLGRGFYGISFHNAHLHRQRLRVWLLDVASTA